MSYMDVNWDFSQFDRDNMHRYQTAALTEAANRLADDELRAADRAIGAADDAFADHKYVAASRFAERAYDSPSRERRKPAWTSRRWRKPNDSATETAAWRTRFSEPGEFIDTPDNGPRGTSDGRIETTHRISIRPGLASSAGATRSASARPARNASLVACPTGALSWRRQ